MLKLNSLSNEVFEKVGLEDVKVNASEGTTLSRNEIVAAGRLVACEYIGSKLNERPTGDKYISRLKGEVNLATLSEHHRDQVLVFCASIANKAVGKTCSITAEQVRNDVSYCRDTNFLRALAAISADVIRPIIFKVYDDVSAGGLMQWESTPFGSTKQIDIASNDVFLFEDGSWGAGRSKSYNELFAKTLTLNPTMHTTQAKIKWYQNIVNGDIGRYYAAIMNGLYNKIYADFIGKILTAASNTALIPTALTANTYTSTNWTTVCTKVAAANGIKRTDLVAFGEIGALSKVLPVDGAGSAITGLQYGLGEEWFKRGYLPNAAGVQLLEVEPVIVPGTQNSTIVTLGTGTNIFVAAKAGAGYAPIYGCYYEGSPITLEMTPSETADMTIDINVGAMFDVKPVFGSKVGVITNVS